MLSLHFEIWHINALLMQIKKDSPQLELLQNYHKAIWLVYFEGVSGVCLF